MVVIVTITVNIVVIRGPGLLWRTPGAQDAPAPFLDRPNRRSAFGGYARHAAVRFGCATEPTRSTDERWPKQVTSVRAGCPLDPARSSATGVQLTGAGIYRDILSAHSSLPRGRNNNAAKWGLPDTSATRHFCTKNVVRDTSTSDLRKVGTLWIHDNTDKTQLHR